jgi:hypothetical protein
MKNNIITSFSIVIISLFHIVGLAQSRDQSVSQKEKIESFKIAFFTRQMQLTPQEATVFWPLYNQYMESMDIQKSNRRKSLQVTKELLDSMSDDEVNKLIDNRLLQAETALNERKEFVTSLRKVLPAKKVAQYFKAEEQFKKKLMEKMNERKQQQRHQSKDDLY